jgi:farnesyl-diphosphate farnesyltransferase
VSQLDENRMREIGREILRSVSRSFYLTIRILPKSLREPIGLAYLLARATDTIADTSDIAAKIRLESLAALSRLIQGEGDVEPANLFAITFAPLQRDEAERALIARIPECIDWLNRFSPPDRADIRAALRSITHGQKLDIQRFENSTALSCLRHSDELHEYTYLVAGCVGEFWTRLGFRHLPNFATHSAEVMTDLGIKYGKALQLINVLRDVGADLRRGRCYFPADELEQWFVEPKDILQQPDRVATIFEKWRKQAEEGLAAGVEYACAIRNFRVRLATILPALIGARTLALLRDAGTAPFSRTIKISRNEMRSIIFWSLINAPSAGSLRKLYRRLLA